MTSRKNTPLTVSGSLPGPTAGKRPLEAFLLRLPADQTECLRSLAQAEGNSIASLIRRAIVQFLASQAPG